MLFVRQFTVNIPWIGMGVPLYAVRIVLLHGINPLTFIFSVYYPYDPGTLPEMLSLVAHYLEIPYPLSLPCWLGPKVCMGAEH